MEAKNQNIAFCGLYCGNCNKFKNSKCPGCVKNDKASWCKIRTCCIENKYGSCADCSTPGIENCRKFNNPIGTLFGFIFNSDRGAGIQLIKEHGQDEFVNYLTELNRMAIPRKRRN